MSSRQATVERNTKETQIKVSVNLDGTGDLRCETGLPFLDHMLDQVARHGLIDLDIKAVGDLHIDAHHTVEDLGITLGMAFNKALDRKGIRRYGHAYVPLDEALSRVVIDFSGRPGLHMRVPFKSGMVGAFDTQLAFEFFQGFDFSCHVLHPKKLNSSVVRGGGLEPPHHFWRQDLNLVRLPISPSSLFKRCRHELAQNSRKR